MNRTKSALDAFEAAYGGFDLQSIYEFFGIGDDPIKRRLFIGKIFKNFLHCRMRDGGLVN